ncbi:MAG: hypothetical protein HQK52_09780 [Oligoflexia bacterium]|nr:hypothetical protein [Oligoflexia bacterium]
MGSLTSSKLIKILFISHLVGIVLLALSTLTMHPLALSILMGVAGLAITISIISWIYLAWKSEEKSNKL